MEKLFSIIICTLTIISSVVCAGRAVSNEKYEEISNCVLENIDKMSVENEIEFFEYEADGGTYFGKPNNGTDWCFIKEITDKWYYYELHWG